MYIQNYNEKYWLLKLTIKVSIWKNCLETVLERTFKQNILGFTLKVNGSVNIRNVLPSIIEDDELDP